MELEQPIPKFPEEMLSSRQFGWIPADRLPWTDPERQDHSVALSLVTFPEGNALIAAAGTPAMNKISNEVREKGAWKNVDFTVGDKLFLRAARWKASGNDQNFGRQQDPSEMFDGFAVECIREGPRPNAHRLYFASTTVEQLTPEYAYEQGVEPDTPILIRLVLTDKQNQIGAIALFSDKSRASLRRASGLGSI